MKKNKSKKKFDVYQFNFDYTMPYVSKKTIKVEKKDTVTNGKVDLIRYNDIIRAIRQRPAPYIDGCEYVVKNKYNVCSSLIKDKRK